MSVTATPTLYQPRLRDWLQAIGFFRGFLLITFMPAALAAFAVYAESQVFSFARFALMLVGAWLLHIGTNLMNEAEDARTGVDLDNPVATPFSGGTHVVEEGKLTPDALHRVSLLAFAFGLALFVPFVALSGWAGFVCAALGAALGYAYTAPPFRLCYRGFGELAVGIVDGPLIALTVCYTQTGRLSPGALATGVVLGLLSSAILTMNEFPDIVADTRGNKRNLVVRLGLQHAAMLHTGLLTTSYLLLVACVLFGLLPRTALVGLGGAVSALAVIRIPKADVDDVEALTRACGGTIRTQILTWVLLCAGYAWTLWSGGPA